MLGRISTNGSCFDKTAYEFWNGNQYVKDASQAKAVFSNKGQGSIYRSDLFNPAVTGKKYVFVGNGVMAESMVIVGTACQLEGPWEFFNVCQATSAAQPNQWMYCIYPHPWAIDEKIKAELMVTWSEHYPGGILAAKLAFDMA